MSILISTMETQLLCQSVDSIYTGTEVSTSTICEQIISFEQNLVRTTDKLQMQDWSDMLNTFIIKLSTDTTTNTTEKQYNRGCLIYLYKLIGQTRDIKYGRGEYQIAYVMIWIWYKHYPRLAEFALSTFVNLSSSGESYGSWKDIKYFCNYIRETGESVTHPLIKYAIHLINSQLRIDIECQQTKSAPLSLAAKWAPRETSKKFGWLYEYLAVNFYPEYIQSATTEESQKKAISKCKTQYRKLLSKLNHSLDTIQIKQCGKNWSGINHSKTTYTTQSRQHMALLNKNSTANIKLTPGCTYRKPVPDHTNDPDRIQCAEDYQDYRDLLMSTIEPSNIVSTELPSLIRNAINLNIYGGNINDELLEETDNINNNWLDTTKKNAGLTNMVAMLNTSSAMRGNSYNYALALGCSIAEKSKLGQQVMSFSENPEWTYLYDCENLTTMVDNIDQKLNTGYSANLYKALEMILEKIETQEGQELSVEDVANMTFVVLTDMDMNENLQMNTLGHVNSQNTECLGELHREWQNQYDTITLRYAAVGMRMCGEAYTPPHILFWNIRGTRRYPFFVSEVLPNVSVMYGCDNNIVKMFCEHGMDALTNLTPWEMLTNSTASCRYAALEEVIQQELWRTVM